MLTAALAVLGIEPVVLGRARDVAGSVERRLRQGLDYDILIVTGAVSAGERDLVPGVLRKLGVDILFHKARIRPGKPVLVGRRRRSLVFGLPGNTVSSLVTFYLFVRPVIERLMGLPAGWVFEKGLLAGPADNASGRLSFLPGRLKEKGARRAITPLRFCDSSDLRSAAAADVFYVLKEDQVKAPAGTPVRFFRIPR
jgi:molybdopterin molybdotransferase